MLAMKSIVFFVVCILITARKCQEEDEISLVDPNKYSGYPQPGDIPVLNRKIFKGHRVPIREHPYVVSIRRQRAHYVVGSLLSRNLVISVAHPIADVPITELAVVSGENYADRGALAAMVIFVVIHENFDPYTLEADIALLRLYEDFKYKNSVKHIMLTHPQATVTGTAFVTGWGRCDSTGMELCLFRSSKFFPDEMLDPMLQSVSFKITTLNDYCEGYHHLDIPVLPGMICLGPARQEDPVCPCLGVPGAPIVVDARLVGILSWGFGCGYEHDLPLVYTNLQNYSSWILHNIIITRRINKNYLTDIYQATEAHLLLKWLNETRLVTPTLVVRKDKNVEPLKIDKDLMKLRGTVYDVRDFIQDGYFQEDKKKIYEDMRNEANTIELLKKISDAVEIAPLSSFLSNNSLGNATF